MLAEPTDDQGAASRQGPSALPPGSAPGTASARWRAAARRVIQMNKSASYFMNVRPFVPGRACLQRGFERLFHSARPFRNQALSQALIHAVLQPTIHGPTYTRTALFKL